MRPFTQQLTKLVASASSIWLRYSQGGAVVAVQAHPLVDDTRLVLLRSAHRTRLAPREPLKRLQARLCTCAQWKRTTFHWSFQRPIAGQNFLWPVKRSIFDSSIKTSWIRTVAQKPERQEYECELE